MRHGQSVGNVTGEPLPDPALTALGALQARALAGRLASVGLTLVFCSPLERALQTAVPIARAAAAPLRACRELVEWNRWGPYAGMTRRDLARRFPEAQPEPGMPEPGWMHPGPESLADGEARLRGVRALVAALPAEARVALVAHGTFNGMLLCAWLGLAPGAAVLDQDNAALSHLRLEPGRVTLLRLNDSGHLRP